MKAHDVVGLLGAMLIVVPYFLLQVGVVTAEQRRYSVMNALGALLVLVSLTFEFNLSAAIVESFWLLISLIGLIRAYRARGAAGADVARP